MKMLKDLPWRRHNHTWFVAEITDMVDIYHTSDGKKTVDGKYGPYFIIERGDDGANRTEHERLDAVEAQCLINHYLMGNPTPSRQPSRDSVPSE